MAGFENPLQSAVHDAYLDACMGELKALKPGNVHEYSDGHDMTVEDFKASAIASAPYMADSNLTLGERILKSIEATQKAVGCNTNLGIVLLCAPLAHCALTGIEGDSLRQRLQHLLNALSVADAVLTYKAIALASPAGLGEHDLHDVNQVPTVTLKEAMAEAAGFDRIAYQYAHGFEDVFETGVTVIREGFKKGLGESWATTCAFMAFLSRFNDTHIERKFSPSTADGIRAEARTLETALIHAADPVQMTGDMLAFDQSLKDRKINPGTSADLTVAGLLAAKLEDIVARPNPS